MRFSSASAGPSASANSASNRSRSAFTRTGRRLRCIRLISGSLKRSLDAIRFLKSQGLKVITANVRMTQNMQDDPGVHVLAAEMGAECTLDPTLPPMMDGNRSAVELGVHPSALRQVFRDPSQGGDADEFCAIPAKASERELESIPGGAGHTACYVSPPGDVFPCVQFPLSTGNVRQQHIVEVCRHSGPMDDVRCIRLKDLTACTSCSHLGSCTRCSGLAYMEGNMRGPSTPDCEKSFVRTGVPSAKMLAKPSGGVSAGQANLSQANLVPMRALPASLRNAAASASA